MRLDNIRSAVAEARRFIQKAEAFEAQYSEYLRGTRIYHFNAPKESGAMRRASMDLTRALAQMRKP